MNVPDIVDEIISRAATYAAQPDFLDHLFGDGKQDALNGIPVVIFGAGKLAQEFHATLKRCGIAPVAFCDNDPAKAGLTICRTPIISFADMVAHHHDSFILIASSKFAAEIEAQLLQHGFCEARIACKPSNSSVNRWFLYLYAMNGVWSLLPTIVRDIAPLSITEKLVMDRLEINRAYQLLADMKSRDLFVSKLVMLATHEHFEAYLHFLTNFSEPFLASGLGDSFETEEYFYFNNDVLSVEQDEVYVDIGAADGDTIATFTQACVTQGGSYRHIYALEPDAANFAKLKDYAAGIPNVSCYELGVWEHSGQLRFMSSAIASHHESAALSEAGDTEITVTALDDFLKDERVTFIKMDPPGNVIPQALRGAALTIAQFRPKLALGAYHSLRAIYEIPLQIESIAPGYKIYLRHNARHNNETDVLAHA